MNRNVATCLREGIHLLESAQVPEARLSAEELLAHVLGKPRFALYLNPEEPLNDQNNRRFQKFLKERTLRYPLQYLIRTIPFRESVLEIGEGCLIPRPETEMLIDVILGRLGSESERVHILDAGTGSGNIAISLAQEQPEWFVTATDISREALRYAKINAERNQVSDRIRLIQTDLWAGIEGSFDALVSNPPYLTELDLSRLQPEIEFEPRVALNGGKGGLLFFKRMIYDAQTILKADGFVFFEVGVGQTILVSEMLKSNGFHSIQISKDNSGIDRFISARLGNSNGSR